MGCATLAYELSHAVEAGSGRVRCRSSGQQYEPGVDCGYFDPDDLAAMELRAAFVTGRCDAWTPAFGPGFLKCLRYHPRWALQACYPHLDPDEVLNRNWDAGALFGAAAPERYGGIRRCNLEAGLAARYRARFDEMYRSCNLAPPALVKAVSGMVAS